MRSKRMRGYGSWCLGWREAERKTTIRQDNSEKGFFNLIMMGFFIFVAITFFSTAIQTGSLFGFLFGAALLCGAIKGIYS